MNVIMQRFAVVTMIFAPLTLATGFFGTFDFLCVPVQPASLPPHWLFGLCRK
jgi:Mg2+ and Co2+ transporter CorA